MPEQNITPVPITEGSTRFRHQHTSAAALLFLAVVGGAFLLTLQLLQPLQRYYLMRYAWASATSQASVQATFVELRDHGRLDLARSFDVAELQGHLALSQWAADHGRGPLAFTPRTVPTSYFTALMRDCVYGGRTAGDVLALAKILCVSAFFLLAIGGLYLDWKNNRRREKGIIRRGSKLMERDEFNRALKSNGVGFPVEGPASIRELLLAPRWRRGVIRLPQDAETSHLLVVGSTGTGKSQLLVQLMHEIQYRPEGAIIYDPDGEFAAEFYDPQRGDVILNPLDKRCPYWCPASELAGNEESLTLAAALFPDPAKADEKNTFFVRAPRQILARLFEYEPTPAQLVSWLADQTEIDKRIKGTEMEAMLSKGAGPQRAGILSSLSMALNAFRLLPQRNECPAEWSARGWAKNRRGWIFLTSKEATRDIQKPLMSMWLDTLLLRLMDKPADGSVLKPVWLIVDELASLQKLPSLQGALTRGRKYQIKTVLGFQAQSQIQEIYGKEGAETIMGNPTSRIFFRTDDPATADWVSRSLGEQETAKEKLSYTRSGGLGGKRSRTYTIEITSERAVTPSQVEGLRNLHGYIRIYDLIASFRLKYEPRTPHAEPFIRRDTLGFVPLTVPEPFQVFDANAASPGQNGLPPGPPQVTAPGGGGAGGGGGMGLAPEPTPDDERIESHQDEVTPRSPIIPVDQPTLLGMATRVVLIHEAAGAIRDAANTMSSESHAQGSGPADGGHGPAANFNMNDLDKLLEETTPGRQSPQSNPVTNALKVVQDVAATASKGRVPYQAQDLDREAQQQAEHIQHDVNHQKGPQIFE